MYREKQETSELPPEPRRSLSRPGRRHMGVLIAVLLLGLGLRVGFAISPTQPQAPDARAYARIAQSLYQDGSFDQRGNFTRGEVQDPNNYSPGLPLLAAGLYELSGGVHLQLARLVLAVIGALAVLLAYLIGRRLGGPAAGLTAALAVAVYPAFLEYQGMLMTEPLAATLLAGSILALLWASDQGSIWAWAWPGLLFGLLALVRPDYLLFAPLLPALAVWRLRGGGWRPGLGAAAVLVIALLLPIVPWTVRNIVVLDRLVPISTGSGKVLFIGSSLEANGDQEDLFQHLLERRSGLRRRLATEYLRPDTINGDPRLLFSQLQLPAQGIDPQIRLSQRLLSSRFIYMERVLEAIAAHRHPGLPTDDALGRMGRDLFWNDLTGQPFEYAGLLADKVVYAWTVKSHDVMGSAPWVALHLSLVAFGLLGLCVLAVRRRWEALPILVLVFGVTATSAVLIASPRRILVLVPVIAALAGVGLTWLWTRARTMRAGL